MGVEVKVVRFSPNGMARWVNVGSDDVFGIVVACFACNYPEWISWR